MDFLKSYYEISPFFFLITVSASTLFFLSNLTMIIGGEFTDSVFDMGGDHIPSDVAFKFFSTQTVLAFFMGFGWAGLTSTVQWKLGMPIAAGVSCLFGLILMSFTAFLMFQINKLNHTSKVSMYSALGVKAVVYTRIGEGNAGQVQVVISGTQKIAKAISSDTSVSIESFAEVEVVGIKDTETFIVRPILKNTPNGENT